MGSLNGKQVVVPTERQVTEDERRLRLLEETVASVAHGLNNLLGAVAAQSAELLDATSGEAGEDARLRGLRLIHQAALDGAGQVRRLLRLSRGNALDGPACLEWVDLRQVVADAIELTRARWHDQSERRGARIVPMVHIAQPLPVRGMPADLREIVMNLILNAVDAMPDGGHLLLRGDALDGAVMLQCQDSGVGMAPDLLARIFEPLFTTKGQHGTGMGLPIVRGVMARLGGEVRVASEVGVGTTITLILPSADAPAHDDGASASLDVGTPLHAEGEASSPSACTQDVTEPWTRSEVGTGTEHETWRSRLRRTRAAAGAAATDKLTASLAGLSILVVEDDPVFRAVFCRRLGLDARRVDAVGDAASALAALETDHWDIACIDDGLPDRPGRALAAEIRRESPGCAVILVTGTATIPDDPSLMAPGVDAILPKPCTDAELARAVQVARTRQADRRVPSA